jgi:hypothetical protein
MRPASLFKQVACQVGLMRSLLDYDDTSAALVVEAGRERLVEEADNVAVLGFALRHLGILQIVGNDDFARRSARRIDEPSSWGPIWAFRSRSIPESAWHRMQGAAGAQSDF